MSDGITRDDELSEALNDLTAKCFNASVKAGWWNDPVTGVSCLGNRNAEATKLLLIHSEISEAVEAHRQGYEQVMDDHLSHRLAVEVELADACVRIFDLAGEMGLDLGGALIEKMEYNRIRGDHQIESRGRIGGKKY